MELITLVVIAVFVVVTSAWVARKKRGQNLLPGPYSLPLVGYLPFLTKKPYIKLQQLAEIYGPVYKLKLGYKNVVMLCDFKSIKEAFAQDAFMGRPPDIPLELSKENIRIGAFLDMPWKEQRRFSLHMFRDLGFGKTWMEAHLKEEIFELLQCIENLKGNPVKISDMLSPSASNNITSLVFGKRLKYNDPKRQRMDKLLCEVSRLNATLAWQTYFPWINTIMSFLNTGNRDKLSRALKETKAIIREEIKEHEATLDPNNMRDFIDAFLLEMEKKKDDPDSTFKKEILEDTARVFFGAGSETVRISVDWLLLIMVAFPEVQKKIHAEIDEVIGRHRFPTRADSLQMPYTEAAILEVNRWKSFVPVNLLRYTLKDTELNGYFIPKHTDVLAVLWAVHHDKSLWGPETDVYRPERFLSEDGKKVVKPEYYVPFSIGKRQCPGKTFAEVEVFLYFTAILQKFSISMPPGKKPNLEGFLGVMLQPYRQEICFTKR